MRGSLLGGGGFFEMGEMNEFSAGGRGTPPVGKTLVNATST